MLKTVPFQRNVMLIVLPFYSWKLLQEKIVVDTYIVICETFFLNFWTITNSHRSWSPVVRVDLLMKQ